MLKTKYKGPWGCGPCGQAEGAGKAVGMGRGQGWQVFTWCRCRSPADFAAT